ncbi:MHS family alpha-ketoglutarate permease-like MFS transporter [Panacagrimonas perspica]|uniref:MHS family alpha-ketoglutarate permease-like MFS transporter n=1 Tax=Panacagrimonas perspica TaxID=381431 RepID=A0A4S3KB77_9GAMM|nr:MFS transporter [Panacagrimonas perspica]TDU32745.1 MHS family alpha-ketoglutarate permease-like MFS transporter [Panacagrimonas perspica]THD05625.1 alpha-ketoglutarate permease [Panacagrimonas perspica]
MSTFTPRQRMRAIFGGSVGNLVEWYDWYTYAAFSLYFAPVFFPKDDLTAQLLNSAAIFAVGFLMRPLGGLLFGWYADRRGRKAALTRSVVLMCFGSLLIALTPGYAQIGVLAPAMLLLARLIQGLSVGGEYGTSATYLSEMATREHRGFWSSFQYVTLILGQLSALAVLILLQAVLTQEQLETWGWRIPFAIGAALAIVALWLRRNLEETESFVVAGATKRTNPARELLRHPRELATVVGLTMGGTLAFYTYTTYMQKFLVNTTGFTKAAATSVSAAALVVFLFVQPLMGALSDRIGRRPLLLGFGIGGMLVTVPLMHALAGVQTPFAAFALITFALLIVSGYTSINAVVKAELFPVEVRALGVGLPYAVTVSIFGGTAEYLALWFKSIGLESGFYWYVVACIGVSLVTYWRMGDTRTTSRIDRDQP